MDSRFLTPGQHGQVADFTGAHTKAGQVRVLVRNGIRPTLGTTVPDPVTPDGRRC